MIARPADIQDEDALLGQEYFGLQDINYKEIAIESAGADPEMVQWNRMRCAESGFRDYLASAFWFRMRGTVTRHSLERFQELASEWKRDTMFTSSTTEIAMHPAYQQIIGFGPVVLPLILKNLAEDMSHWFWALKAISGDDPVTPEHRGDVEAMTNDWLEWGNRRGLC